MLSPVSARSGREGHDVKSAEVFLRADELTMLNTAWQVASEREAIRGAARGLWEWTRYMWAQCEQVIGEELGIVVDTAAVLGVIERSYA